MPTGQLVVSLEVYMRNQAARRIINRMGERSAVRTVRGKGVRPNGPRIDMEPKLEPNRNPESIETSYRTLSFPYQPDES